MKLQSLLWDYYVPSRMNLSHNGAKQLEFVLNSFERSLGHPPTTGDLTPQALQEWMRKCLQRLSRATVRRQRSRLLTLWRWAWKKQLCETPPPDDLEPIRVPRKIPQAWTIDEVGAILQRCRTLEGKVDGTDIKWCDWWTSLNLFLYDTGARVNAALSVRSADLALSQRCCLLRSDSSKTWLEQVVQFSTQTAEAIARLHDIERELVWPWPKCRRQLFKEYKTILADAGVDAGRYVGFHKMRRTHATQAVRTAGWEVASRDLGHTSIRMTQAYVDLRQLQFGRVDLPRPTFR